MVKGLKALSRLTVISLAVLFVSSSGAMQSLTRDRFPTGTYLEGDFTANFSREGELIVFTDHLVKAQAVYKVAGNTIVIKERDGQGECSSEGKYKWKFDGKALTFTKVSDTCPGRVRHLTSRAWHLVKREK